MFIKKCSVPNIYQGSKADFYIFLCFLAYRMDESLHETDFSFWAPQM